MHDVVAERLTKERDFHNRRVATDSDNRKAQSKYYFSVSDCFDLYRQKVSALAQGADILEYGCFTGKNSFELAQRAKSVTGIDLSDYAIQEAKQHAAALGQSNARFLVMNAEELSFADASFDVVFGSGILHHLDLDKAFSQIARVLRPGGKAIFVEPFGHNFLFKAYRAVTPKARTVDEHPLLWRDLDLAQRYFASCRVVSFGLVTLLAVPLRKSRFAPMLLRLFQAVDRWLFKLPFLQKQAWVGLIEFSKERKRNYPPASHALLW